jgi:cell division transport system ATP-binding protein
VSGLPNPDAVQTKNQIIRLFHVHRRYGSKRALVDVSLDIYRNDFLFVTGPSGAGKTTLLKLLYLGEPVSDGQILVGGMNLSRIPRRRVPSLRRQFGIIFQDYKLIPTKSVFDNIALVLEAAGHKQRIVNKRVASVLRLVGLEGKETALPPSLSGGEQQRVAVARAVIHHPEIILADEPTASLDTAAAGLVLQLLSHYHRRGGTVIVATHDADLIRQFGGRVVHLKEGRLLRIDETAVVG